MTREFDTEMQRLVEEYLREVDEKKTENLKKITALVDTEDVTKAWQETAHHHPATKEGYELFLAERAALVEKALAPLGLKGKLTANEIEWLTDQNYHTVLAYLAPETQAL
ncbi:hypothetical protein FACS1894164_11150 [Spirochaetia bacterium]|nr:hypothetical protein FACS1894164_11150 [Spirochaetia bacterium]